MEVIVPCGIEDCYPAYNNNESYIKKSNVITLLFVGVVKSSKGVDDLIRAFAMIQDLDVKTRLRIVGKVESVEYHDTLKQLISDLNIEKSVDFCGVKTGDDKFQEYNNADIFCFPTFFESETFGVVILEAMSFQLPVISTYWRGIPSIIRNEETGLLFPINDIEKLAAGIRRLVVDKKIRVEMGAKGRKHFLDNYTISTFNKNMNNVFSAVKI